ncbi:Kazal-type serine protease inhibitor domain-containing protein [Aquamicrobium segne]|uniref:Kazal-type serine protease inhibitor domain-containing protein n=1 Tax=Aquamicrobium segne TaxID=469547 RepID=A0ABW0GWK7_9HYPH
MKFRNVFLAGAALLLSSGFLTACVVDEGPGYRPPPPRPRPPAQACTREYAPVCGVRGSDSRTFANSCQARASNYRISHEGACRSSGNRPDTNRPGANKPGWGHQPGSRPGQRPNRSKQACTREYAPVCASSRGQLRTFPNSCEARAAEWRIVSNGACR